MQMRRQHPAREGVILALGGFSRGHQRRPCPAGQGPQGEEGQWLMKLDGAPESGYAGWATPRLPARVRDTSCRHSTHHQVTGSGVAGLTSDPSSIRMGHLRGIRTTAKGEKHQHLLAPNEPWARPRLGVTSVTLAETLQSTC